MLNKMSLGQKIILSSCIFLFLCFAGINAVTLKKMHAYSKEQGNSAAVFTSKYNGKVFENYFDKIKTIGESIANQCETLVENNNPSRDLVLATLKNTLSTYDDYIFGATVAYEPNKFDNNDSNSIGLDGSSTKGEFTPYVTRGEENLYWIQSAFSSDDTSKQNKWYEETKKTKKVYLTEPTVYKVNDKSIAMVSVAIPILRNNEFVGVVSIDASLDYLQNQIIDDKPFGGFSEVVSSDGLYIASGNDSSKILKHVSSYNINPSLYEGNDDEDVSDVHIVPESKEKYLIVSSPITLDNCDQVWRYISFIPFSNIFNNFNVYFKIIFFAGLFILSFIIYINYWIISRDL